MTQNISLSVEAPPKTRKKVTVPRLVLLVSILLTLAAWLVGYFSTGTAAIDHVPEVLPGAARVETRAGLFIGLDANGQVVGYAAVGQGHGYGGPIKMLVGIDPAGQISGVKIIAQHETPGFFRLVTKNEFIAQFLGLSYRDPLALKQDLDAVSGATLSSEGIAASARQAVRLLARDGLNSPLPPETFAIKFGWPEITLIGLFAAGYFGHKLRSTSWKRRVRWGTLLTGMLVLGFIYTAPLTIAQFISLLSGYWPDWRNNLYWYILIGGILFVTSVDAKNPYCAWFCPFGAVQECLAQVTGAKNFRPSGWSTFFTWLQRGLAFAAVLLGLALRRPGVAGYEPFATLFDLRGSSLEVTFLLVTLLASLMMYRPFCNYLCPLDPVYEFIAESRRWVREIWSAWRR